IVSTFKIQKDSYNWKVNDFKIANPEQLVIYELHLRDFTASSDINGAMGKLSYLKAMGVNAIELMPVQEFDGNDSWGYNPCFFFAMDKAYGTKAMYKQFIDACHEAGMAVILDVVYNHATGNNPLAKLYWDG
ncbi:alpha-amylase family glycosyl hydrolase, partial [Phocaeicola vulgatus]